MCRGGRDREREEEREEMGGRGWGGVTDVCWTTHSGRQRPDRAAATAHSTDKPLFVRYISGEWRESNTLIKLSDFFVLFFVSLTCCCFITGAAVSVSPDSHALKRYPIIPHNATTQHAETHPVFFFVFFPFFLIPLMAQ